MEPQSLSIAPALALLAALIAAGELVGRFHPFYRDRSAGEGHRFPALDGLRGFLALGVFLHHGVTTYFYARHGVWTCPSVSPAYMNLGPGAVDLFFAITGLLFWDKVLEAQGRLDWASFYRSRIRRLLPMYAVSAALVLVIAFSETRFQLAVPLKVLGNSILDWFGFGISGRSDVNGFAGTGRINAFVFWTLTFEWGFYLALPAMAAFRRGWGFAALLAFGGVYLLGRLGLVQVSWFMVGMVSAVLYRRFDLRRASASPLVSFAALGLMILAFALPRQELRPLRWAAEVLFFVAIANGNSLFGLLEMRGARVLGMVSYSVYVLHGIALYALRRAWPPAEFSAVLFWMQMTGASAALLAVSLSTYRWIEVPFLRRRPDAIGPATAR